MTLYNYLLRRKKKKPTAQLAKERLQIILAHERAGTGKVNYLPALKQDILHVVSKYVTINEDDIKINLEHEGQCEILELNIALPDGDKTLST